eukprot:scaffold6388_cov121-Skeletonema_marinoi.AAC.1
MTQEEFVSLGTTHDVIAADDIVFPISLALLSTYARRPKKYRVQSTTDQHNTMSIVKSDRGVLIDLCHIFILDLGWVSSQNRTQLWWICNDSFCNKRNGPTSSSRYTNRSNNIIINNIIIMSLLTVDSVADYVLKHADQINVFPSDAVLTAEAIQGGNVNFAFCVRSSCGKSVFVKQAPEY